MDRALGWASLAQGAVYAGAAALAWGFWVPAGVLVAVAAVAQGVGGAALLAGRGDTLARWAGGIALAVCAIVGGLVVEAAIHVIVHFTPVGAEQAWALLGGVGFALPWAIAVPVAQLGARRWLALGASAAAALLVGVTLGARVLPSATYAPVDPEAAAWLYARLATGATDPPPAGEGPVRLVVALLRDGEILQTLDLRGDTLQAALAFTPPGPTRATAVYVDVVTRERALLAPVLATGAVYAAPGTSAVAGADRALTSAEVWHGEAVRGGEPAPGVFAPGLRADRLPKDPRALEARSYLASAAGVTALERSWTPGPALDPQTALDAAVAGARMLIANQDDTGRFTYVVRGPSGRPGSGYNYPRHAGTAWFLARVAVRTGDPEVRAAAERALGFLRAATVPIDADRRAVLDPSRRDGKVWVGTTALAALAALTLGADADGWVAFVASAVDADGKVRGDLDRATATWPEQPSVTYAQGQGMLALAAADRAGHAEVGPALDRAMAHVRRGYAAMPASRFFVLDEHWMCLAAWGVLDARGEAVGDDVCTAYLAGFSVIDPRFDGPLQPSTGASGGVAEALVARAWIARRRGEPDRWAERALGYGDVYLRHQYHDGDAPLLSRPRALIGGFRPSVWSLDVQIDAVQHIGSALLGMEALLSGEVAPGAMP